MATHNLAYGVVVGVLTAMVLFARRVAHLTEVVDVAHPDEDTRVYAVRGRTVLRLQQRPGLPVRLRRRPGQHRHRYERAHIWDASTVAALDAITTKVRGQGKHVSIIGLNEPSAQRHGRLVGRLEGQWVDGDAVIASAADRRRGRPNGTVHQTIRHYDESGWSPRRPVGGRLPALHRRPTSTGCSRSGG